MLHSMFDVKSVWFLYIWSLIDSCVSGAQHSGKQSADEPTLITLCLHDLHHSIHGYSVTTSVTATFSLSQHASANLVRSLALMSVTLENLLLGHRPLILAEFVVTSIFISKYIIEVIWSLLQLLYLLGWTTVVQQLIKCIGHRKRGTITRKQSR